MNRLLGLANGGTRGRQADRLHTEPLPLMLLEKDCGSGRSDWLETLTAVTGALAEVEHALVLADKLSVTAGPVLAESHLLQVQRQVQLIMLMTVRPAGESGETGYKSQHG